MTFIFKSVLIISTMVFGVSVFLYPLSEKNSEQRKIDVLRLRISGVIGVLTALAIWTFGW